MTNLNLVANIGLTLFLFIIGLEVDLRFLLTTWKVALNVGVASMAIPFGLGCAIAVGLYNEFKDEPGTVQIEFPIFMLFIGVAMAITVSFVGFGNWRHAIDISIGFPRPLSYSYGAKAARNSCRSYCTISWCRERRSG